jgi:hypothetical protein
METSSLSCDDEVANHANDRINYILTHILYRLDRSQIRKARIATWGLIFRRTSELQGLFDFLSSIMKIDEWHITVILFLDAIFPIKMLANFIYYRLRFRELASGGNNIDLYLDSVVMRWFH